MKNQILKAAKGLRQFSIEDLELITGFDEVEIKKYLDIFEKEMKISKISDENYLIIKEIIEENKPKQKIYEFSEQELEIYKKAPEWARKQVEKHLTILRLTHGLTGKRLRNFVKTFNELHPEMKTCYSNVNCIRLKFRKDGLLGLLAKYSTHNKAYSCIKEEMYTRFKELYFSKQAPSLLSCYTKLKKEYYQKGIWQVPSYLTFTRKLKAEFTPEQVNFLRRKPHQVFECGLNNE